MAAKCSKRAATQNRAEPSNIHKDWRNLLTFTGMDLLMGARVLNGFCPQEARRMRMNDSRDTLRVVLAAPGYCTDDVLSDAQYDQNIIRRPWVGLPMCWGAACSPEHMHPSPTQR